MSFLQLKSITCLKKQELIRKDKPIIKLDGNIVWSGFGFTKDTVSSLENVEPHRFTNQIKLELLEQDKGQDDPIGEKVIDDKPQSFGAGELSFTNKGASYEITYEVR